MVHCSILNCRSRSERKEENVTFHSFPKDREIRKFWIFATGRLKWTPKKYDRICSKHFLENCFQKTLLKVYLKAFSIPTLAIGDSKKLYKCNMCIRTYSSKEALERHKIMHSKKMKLAKLRATRNLRPPARAAEKEDKVEQRNLSLDSRNFVCPVCTKTFPSEFVAQKHIDVYHQKVKFLKEHTLIQFIECRKCNQKIKNFQPHLCQEVKPNKKSTYMCSACNQKFHSIKLFDNHTVLDHSDKVESLFFPTLRDFANWKESMEKATSTAFTEIEEHDGKKYYHCSQNVGEENEIDRCPSMILVQLYPKGVQANFYRQHFKHSCTEYKLTSAYKKYCITSLLKPSDSIPNIDGDPYLHLKTLMDNIVIEAAKINIDSLKQLMGKALEMTLILNNYDEEKEETRPNKFLSDAEITHVLQNNSTTIKRVRIEPNISLEPEIKKPKLSSEEMAPKIVNTFSLAGEVFPNSDTDSGDDIDNEILKSNSTPVSKMKEALISVRKIDDLKEKEFTSFNDTYKDFVSKNFVDTKSTTPSNRMYGYQVRNNIYQTLPEDADSATPKANSAAINNTKPNSEATDTKPIQNTAIKKTPTIKVRDDIIKTPSKEQSLQNIKNEGKPTTNKGSPQLKNKDTKTSTSKPQIKKPLQEKIKSNIIRPSKEKLKTQKTEKVDEKTDNLRMSKSKTPPIRVTSEPSKVTASPKKIDYEYEVIEQETGCNILVLKL